ncbi:magnesium chelatase domain-containing protein, partial [Bordetella pertussis]|uniref:magnesium chelatase domain-containing protein n=1 Tax=Bordetella pertussis TaxID=520 RepID=UPI003877B4A9
MTLAVLASRAIAGWQAPAVRVETHLGSGLPAFAIVGLPDVEVRESRERVRAAIQNSGFDFPPGRITVNLSPADLPKASARFDLPICGRPSCRCRAPWCRWPRPWPWRWPWHASSR